MPCIPRWCRASCAKRACGTKSQFRKKKKTMLLPTAHKSQLVARCNPVDHPILILLSFEAEGFQPRRARRRAACFGVTSCPFVPFVVEDFGCCPWNDSNRGLPDVQLDQSAGSQGASLVSF